MKFLIFFFLVTRGWGLSPQRVAILYNSDLPSSKQIAEHYQEARQIPRHHLIGLPLSQQGAVSVAEYVKTIEDPLKAAFDRQKLWKRSSGGRVLECAVDVLVTVYGVPFKTTPTPLPPTTQDDGTVLPARLPTGFEGDAASVDSELSMLKSTRHARKGALKNPYFESLQRYETLREKPLLLVGRIDGPSPEICHRMIRDAVEVERGGLFGMTYLDYAYKGAGYEQGDAWLREIHRLNRQYGIPTVQEKSAQVFVTNYPLSEAALYYGWYAHHYSGPFRNPTLTLKKGSIVTHLHSFSAADLRNPDRHWSGPLLQRGAAATLGNVHEPFLQFSHHFHHFHKRLLKGWTLIEAAYAAHPATSWQGIVLGDPLYRPFVHSRKARPVHPGDAAYYQLRSLGLISSRKQFSQLQSLATKQNSGRLFEALALAYLEGQNHKKALSFFKKAQQASSDPVFQLRQIIHQVDYYRAHDQPDKAVTLLQAHQIGYEGIAEHQALVALKALLSPPPPPPNKPEEATH